MANNQFQLTTPSALDAAEALIGLVEEFFPSNRVSASVSANISGMTLSFAGLGAEMKRSPAVQLFVSNARTRPFLQSQSITIDINDDNPTDRVRMVYQDPGDDLPFFRVDAEPRGENKETLYRVVDGLHKYFHVSTRSKLIRANMPQAEREILQEREDALVELREGVATIGRFALEQVKSQSEHLKKLTAELERKYQERERVLEEKAKSREEELDQKRKVFEAEKAAFDDRDRTHVRRELLGKLNTIIAAHQAKLGVSKLTGSKRWITHVMCWLLMLGAGTLMASFAYKIFEATVFEVRFITPLMSGALILGSTAIYYLKWNNQWFHELARSEFANRKFEADVTRASWIAELFFELKEQKDSGFPEILVKSFTAGLFEDPALTGPNDHPVEQLLSIMKEAKSLKVGANAVEFSKG